MNRRGFLGSILALGAAPAIVRADSLMRIIPSETTLLMDAMHKAFAAGGEPSVILAHPSFTEIVTKVLRENAPKIAANISRQNKMLAKFNRHAPGGRIYLLSE